MKKTMFFNCSKKLKKTTLLTFALFLCVSMIGMAQVTVTGTVTDLSNQPLPGTNIIIKGTSIGAQTDFDGNFSIEAKAGDALVISYLGFVTKEIVLGDETKVSITLEEDASQLDEVVVVGYGSKSRTKLISSVSTVDAETLTKIPVPNVSNALEGLASGLFVRQGSGEPGFSNSSFEVRNFGAALVIIDGAPGDLNQLDANEIENISVLKDAAAAAIYGVQGGNGVVLITTKKGNIGKPKFTYSNQFTWTSFTTFPGYLTSGQYGEVLNEGLRNSNQDPFYTEEELELYRNGSDPLNYPNTDWKSLTLEDSGFQQRHNINLSGGTDKAKYFVSAGYLDQGSNYTADVLSYQQFNLRSNISANITDNLELTFNLAGRRRLNEAPGYSALDIFRELSRALPTDLAYYPDGTPARPSSSPTHVVEGMRDFNAGYYRRRNNNFDAKISLKWDINQVPGLSLKTYASIVYDTSLEKDWNKSFDLFTLNRQTGNYDAFRATPLNTPSETVLEERTNYSNHYVLQNSINYERAFGDHKVSALLLAEVQKRQGQDFNGRRQDFQSTLIDQLFAGAIENQGANGGEFRENRLGFVGRFGYDYQSKYFIESTYRYDGSSKFAPGQEWGLFPSISLGWRLSEESFFESLKNTIPELKLRGSVGTAGSDNTSAYQWLSGFNYDLFYAINETAIPTLNNGKLPNEFITWETNTTYDIGLDTSLFNRELNLSFDYFYRKREDVIAGANASVPSTLGVELADQNLYEFSNEGFEISANYRKQLNENWKITAALNYSRSREKAIFIDETLQEDPFMRANLTETGGFTGLRRGFISDGLFQSQEEIDNHAIQDGDLNNTTIQVGDVKYVDLNDNGVINEQDQKVFGKGNKPANNYSLNLGAEYKNFALSVLLTGASGYDIYIGGEAQGPLQNGFTGYDYQMDYWTPENTGAAYPRITNGGFNPNNSRYSDFWLRDAKHIRLKNVNLSYTLPKRKENPVFDEVRFSVTGVNLFVIKDYDEDFDPQISGDNADQGWIYPQTKSISFGLNVSL